MYRLYNQPIQPSPAPQPLYGYDGYKEHEPEQRPCLTRRVIVGVVVLLAAAGIAIGVGVAVSQSGKPATGSGTALLLSLQWCRLLSYLILLPPRI